MRFARHLAGIGIALAIVLIPRVQAADDGVPPLSSPASAITSQGRALLRAGRLLEAERAVRTALEASTDGGALTLAGELCFRRGDFPAARLAFDRAIALNQDEARAWWGLGRIEQLHFRRDAARDLYARAYRLNPLDPDILLSYLEFVTDPAARAVLLRKVVAVARDAQPEHAQRAQGRLELESRLAGRETGVLTSPYIGYRLPLAGFRPTDANQHGLVITARVNGGRPLHLVLDTGARGILIHKTAARDLRLEPLAASHVAGLGPRAAAESTLSLARSVTFGALEFRDCLIEVISRDVAAGIDGILGPRLFEQFVIRIDPKTRVLELAPHTGTEGPAAPTQNALDLDRLLLVRAEMARGHEGWFLLDTGSAYTAVATDSAAASARRDPLEMTGVQGALGAFRVSPLTVRVAGRSLADPETIAMDLGAVSQREGVEISGILGYSTLSRWPVTIDFRSGQVRLGDSR